MNPWGRVVVVVFAVGWLVMGWFGRSPTEWLGLTTGEFIGYLLVLAPVGAILAVLIVVWDRQHQLLRRIVRLERGAGRRRERRGTVVRGPWEGSGS